MSELQESTPPFQPIRQTEVNDEILIYEGPMKLHSGMDDFQKPDGIGKAVYSWFPYPRVSYNLELKEYHGTVVSTEYKIAHEGLDAPTLFYKLSEDFDGKVQGFIEEYQSPGKEMAFDSILFQFPNLALFVNKMDPGQGIPQPAKTISFSVGKYSLILQNTMLKSQLDSVSGKHGYILNGVVELKKPGKLVSLVEVNKLISVFFEFLSFLNGLKVKPVIVFGIRNGEQRYIKYSTEVNVPAFLPSRTWVPGVIEEDRINKSWQTFSELCKDEEERDFFQLAIHWYLESLSMRSGIDAAIALVQNALELLSSRILYEKEFILKSSEGIDKVSASSKINILLTWAHIPNRIPSGAIELVKYGKARTFKTGPEVITEIRNSIVHPHLKNRSKHKEMNLPLKHEALNLALEYVELVLLKLINYDGKYHNRFNAHPIHLFKNDAVPWVN
jgi:hypothetical protein